VTRLRHRLTERARPGRGARYRVRGAQGRPVGVAPKWRPGQEVRPHPATTANRDHRDRRSHPHHRTADHPNARTHPRPTTPDQRPRALSLCRSGLGLLLAAALDSPRASSGRRQEDRRGPDRDPVHAPGPRDRPSWTEPTSLADPSLGPVRHGQRQRANCPGHQEDPAPGEPAPHLRPLPATHPPGRLRNPTLEAQPRIDPKSHQTCGSSPKRDVNHE